MKTIAPYRSLFFFCWTLVAALCLTACFSVKSSSSKSGKRLFETFYVGEKGTQYFIKPLIFKSETGKELLVDFTFRYKDEVKDSTTINFSIKGSDIVKSVFEIRFQNSTFETVSSKINLLFNERKKDDYISRFSTTIPTVALVNIYVEPSFFIVIKEKEQREVFMPTNATKDSNKKLIGNLFVLLI